ncbi:hypothetical protein GCM10011390_20550 [Aureimonas endophytica]|uniref:Glycine zipper 2TM protein n=1 Tax=Aureimonas endophytica TaxID=2027858 RepID=A0A917E419_9HYPH|nr:hypothetical protein [Aureimonas endophytica]GGE01542.1 hypothetical protein GCM10011390_20550 [Aureimonas endophytica]
MTPPIPRLTNARPEAKAPSRAAQDERTIDKIDIALHSEASMRKTATIALVAILTVAAGPSYAAGCLKGAAVGGVGGHFVGKGHAVAGAAVGCVIGHHRAKVEARKQAQDQAAQPVPKK